MVKKETQLVDLVKTIDENDDVPDYSEDSDEEEEVIFLF